MTRVGYARANHVCDLLWVNYGFTDGIKIIIEEITRGL